MPVCQLLSDGDLPAFRELDEANCEDRDVFVKAALVESKNACTAEGSDRARLPENNLACSCLFSVDNCMKGRLCWRSRVASSDFNKLRPAGDIEFSLLCSVFFLSVTSSFCIVAFVVVIGESELCFVLLNRKGVDFAIFFLCLKLKHFLETASEWKIEYKWHMCVKLPQSHRLRRTLPW